MLEVCVLLLVVYVFLWLVLFLLEDVLGSCV